MWRDWYRQGFTKMTDYKICQNVTLYNFSVLELVIRSTSHVKDHRRRGVCVLWMLLVGAKSSLTVVYEPMLFQSGLCLPLPITRHQFTGKTFAFVVFIVFNFALFLLIGIGQSFIYRTVVKTGSAVSMGTKVSTLIYLVNDNSQKSVLHFFYWTIFHLQNCC